jgi:hypothetical protein
MPEFRFAMVDNGIERVCYVTITNKELTPRHMISTYDPLFYELYRKTLLETKLNSWALSKLNLSWEEVTQDEGHSNQSDSTAQQSQA